MKQQSGFTVVELIIVIILLIASALLVTSQINQIDQVSRDKQRKIAINSIHLNLEEVYYKQNRSYPNKINADTLPALDSELLKDPKGVQLNDTGSDYHYEPADCRDTKCTSYLLYADLEKEARYEKRSR